MPRLQRLPQQLIHCARVTCPSGQTEARAERTAADGKNRVERAVAAAEEAGEQLRLADGRATTLQRQCTPLAEQVLPRPAPLV